MNQLQIAEQFAQELVEQLQSITDEETIKSTTLITWQKLEESIPNPNSFKRPSTTFRKIIESNFPNSNEPKPGFYRTSAGKGNKERYEHLALWYCTTHKERWNVIGDDARTNYWDNSNALTENTTQINDNSQNSQQTEPIKLTLEHMTIEQLGLTTEIENNIREALEQSKTEMNLAEFIRQACNVYAKTITGKAKQFEDDLSSVKTEELLNTSQYIDGKETRTKYYTHPGRAEELTKRAIVAITKHNDNATENDQRWMITQTAIQALTGSKPATIKNILEQYKPIIDDHNSKYQLNAYVNRKADKRKIEKEINLSELVPDGLNL